MPVLEKTKFAYSLWYQANQNLPKPFRAGLGSRIENAFLDVLELQFQATYTKDIEKISLVKKAILKLDILKFFLRVAWEQKHLLDKTYISISKPLEEAGRMLYRWQEFLEQKLPRMARENK